MGVWFDFFKLSALLVPYLTVLWMPAYGFLYGIEYIFRFSLHLLYFIHIKRNVITRAVSPLGGLLLFASLCFPAFWIPNFVIWIYEQLLIYSDPLLLLFEVVQGVYLIRLFSKWMVSIIDDSPNYGKGLILSVSAASYALTVPLVFSLFPNNQWYVGSLMVLQGTIHIAAIYKETGTLSDAAVTCAASFLALYAGHHESSIRINMDSDYAIYHNPSSARKVSSGSFWQLLLEMPRTNFVHAQTSVTLLRATFSMIFWLLLIIRIMAVLRSLKMIGPWLCKLWNESEDVSFDLDLSDSYNNDDDDDQGVLHRVCNCITHLSTPAKMAAVFAYTQLVLKHVTLALAEPSVNPSFLSTTSPGRLLQSFGLGVLMLYQLHADDEDD